VLSTFALAPIALSALPWIAAENVSLKAAKLLRAARTQEAQSDHRVAISNCIPITDPQARKDCIAAAKVALQDDLEEAKDQYDARAELAEQLGPEGYDPQLDSAQFSSNITNPHFPLVPGTVRVYVGQTQSGTETVTTTVLSTTKLINGIPCRVVHDVAELNGSMIEDTLDYYSQDSQGNVWYLGEHTMEIEDGVAVSMDGTWIAGTDGAKPGIIMLATPAVDDVYRQEYFATEAEDAARVESVTASATVPFGAFSGCIQTFDFTPIEPSLRENKYYALNVGIVLEVNLETGERLELVSVTTP